MRFSLSQRLQYGALLIYEELIKKEIFFSFQMTISTSSMFTLSVVNKKKSVSIYD